MLTGLHFLLTYMCNSECDHCFVYSGPRSRGTFTLKQVQQLLDEAARINTIEWIYFEGGEPFLFYPIMLEGIKMARQRGFKVGIVTNSYFATDPDDIATWLKPFCELGIHDFKVSNDPYHYEDEKDNPAIRTHKVAQKLNLPVGDIHLESPSVTDGSREETEKGKPIIGGDIRFRGRAVETLTAGLPLTSWQDFTECPYEELGYPSRVHLDSYGNVHICQGLSMGNCWETPLSELVKSYNATTHPVCGPLVKGGPVALAREYRVNHQDGFVDACHFCYLLRLALLERFPRYLAPRQVYGLE